VVHNERESAAADAGQLTGVGERECRLVKICCYHVRDFDDAILECAARFVVIYYKNYTISFYEFHHVLFGYDPSESLPPHDQRAAVLSAGVSQLNTSVTCGLLHHMSAVRGSCTRNRCSAALLGAKQTPPATRQLSSFGTHPNLILINTTSER
jgi:hypothetical protein